MGRPRDNRPPRRGGKGGVGPGPAYRPSPGGGGTKHGGQTRPPSKACKDDMVIAIVLTLFYAVPRMLLARVFPKLK